MEVTGLAFRSIGTEVAYSSGGPSASIVESSRVECSKCKKLLYSPYAIYDVKETNNGPYAGAFGTAESSDNDVLKWGAVCDVDGLGLYDEIIYGNWYYRGAGGGSKFGGKPGHWGMSSWEVGSGSSLYDEYAPSDCGSKELGGSQADTTDGYVVISNRYHSLWIKPNGGEWDGSSMISRRTIYEGGSVSISDPSDRTKNGYEFDGWECEGAGSRIDPTTKVFTMGTEDAKIKAKWKAIDYTITYELGGGTNGEGNPGTYTVESDVFLEEPTRTGYTFTGWTGSNGDTPSRHVFIFQRVNRKKNIHSQLGSN